MRRPVLLITISFLVASLASAGQKTSSAARPARPDFLPAGPFLFEPGAVHPTYMDAFDGRPAVKSPDGRTQITVTGPADPLEAWVTLQFLGQQVRGLEYRVWPISSDVDVLWRPDSQAFALTDNRYSNRSYILVFGTDFRMGESDSGLGVPITDLTSIVLKLFEDEAQKYYAASDYDILHFYAKALRWIENDQLLIGVSANAIGPPALPNRGIKDWDMAYLVDVPKNSVVREISESELLSQYGIKVFHQ